jgi:hypothetical protein
MDSSTTKRNWGSKQCPSLEEPARVLEISTQRIASSYLEQLESRTDLQHVGTVRTVDHAGVKARDFTRRSCHLILESRPSMTHLKHFEEIKYSSRRQ